MTTPREQHSLFGEILDWMLAPLLLLWPMSVTVTYIVAQSIANAPFDRGLADAVVALANQDKLGIPADRINVRGGAVALGHPIGCSGARVLVTLLYALDAYGKRRGIASLCLGGGEAVALMVER